MVAGAAVVILGAFTVGCGPAPGYEPEPRVPEGYAPLEPGRRAASAEELQMQAQARADAQAQAGDVPIGESADEYTDTDPSALTEFKPALDGHGAWVDDSTYGTVWVPESTEVGSDFEPYVTAGHWTYDDDQSWVWVSDYDWGWAPFHYGRWVRLPSHGWSWIPGRVYSGAWVTWRVGPSGYDYVGWAPAAPEWYWYDGYAVGWTFGWYHPSYWYCHHDYIYDRGWRGHAVYGGTPQGQVIGGRTAPYTPAPPSHVAANPTVNGPAHVAATPRVNGPKPSDLGIKQGSVVKPPSDDNRLAKARTYATPSSATKVGAAAPSNTRRPHVDDGVAGQPGREIARPNGGDRMSPSVASRLEPSARAPQVVTNPAPRPSNNGFAGRVASQPSTSTSIHDSQPSVVQRPTVTNTQPQPRPSFSNTPTVRSQPSQPSVTTNPTVRSQPSFSSTPTVRSQPSVSSTPTVRSNPTPSSPTVRSSPTVHSSPSTSTPTFRSSAPSVSRSAPSVHSAPSTHSSSPSRSAPSVSRGGRGGRR